MNPVRDHNINTTTARGKTTDAQVRPISNGMKKVLKKLFIPTLALFFIFAINIATPLKVAAKESKTCISIIPSSGAPPIPVPKDSDCPSGYIELPSPTKYIAEKTGEAFKTGVAWIVERVLGLVSLLTGISGVVLNGVVYFTVVKVHDAYSVPEIAQTWGIVRDIANMSFIFVLLYAAIMTIIGQGQDNKRLIITVVVVAVLLNFSLFLTKVVIDIANLFALTFYDAIAPGALRDGQTWTEMLNPNQNGLSNAFMQHMNLQTLYDNRQAIDITNLITVGVMGSILLLIAAFVFFAVALLFIIRYAVLILVMILSPIYFISWALPKGTGIDQYKDQWKDALVGQAFFAPIFFMLVWVSLSILNGIGNSFGETASEAQAALSTGIKLGEKSGMEASGGFFVLLINFTVVIIMLIVSLTQAKKWADKAGGGMSGLTKWATGFAGGATIGMAGKFGRGTIGRAGQAVGDSNWLKDKAANSNFVGKFAAKQALQAGRGVGASSFDLRGTGIGKQLDAGKAGGKGGFADYRKKKAEAEAKFANSLGPSDNTIGRAQSKLNDALEIDESSTDFHEERLKEQDRRRAALQNLVNKKNKATNPEEKAKLEEKIKKAEKAHAVTLDGGAYKASLIEERKKVVEELKKTARERKNAYARSIEKSRWAKLAGYNHAATAQIRKEKSKKEKLAEAAAEYAKEEAEAASTPEPKPESESGEGIKPKE